MVQASVAKLEHTGKVRRRRLCQMEKEQSRQFRVPDREGGESQGEREKHFDERRDQSGSMKRKGWTPQ